MQKKYIVALAVAIISVIGTIIAAIINNWSGKTPDSESTYYRVRVVDKVSRTYVANAKVTIELSDNSIIPIDSITDANGFAIIPIPIEHISKPGKLIVEAREYQTFNKFIDLSLETLPEVVELDKK